MPDIEIDVNSNNNIEIELENSQSQTPEIEVETDPQIIESIGTVPLYGPRGPKGDKGDQGETGNGIITTEKTSTSGIVDTYTIYYTNGTTSTFDVTNGTTTNYVHVQDVASDTWVINHNLGKLPSSVLVMDSAGSIFYPNITNITTTSCTIELIGAMAGKASVM